MQKIDNEKLDGIKGGEMVSFWSFIAVSSLVVFISGVVEGITNPKRCIE